MFQRAPFKKNIKRKASILFVVLVLVVAATFLSPFGADPTHAAISITAQQGVENSVLDQGLGAVSDVLAAPLRLITWIFMQIASFFVLFSGWLFDFAIEFGTDSSHYRLDAIQLAWSVLRDIANVTFIFVLLYIAIATILQLGSNHKRTLIMLIIAALLVNFSFFFTGIIIDIGNILALFLYNAMTADGTVSLSGILQTGLRLASLVDPTTQDATNNAHNLVLTVKNMMASIFLFTAAFVLFAGAIMFVVRIVFLILSLIFSPLAFVAMILPKTRKYWDKWIGGVIGQAFAAPIFLLFIFVIVAIIQGGELLSKTTEGGTQSLSVAISGLSLSAALESSIGVVFNYMVLIALMVSSLIATKAASSQITALSTKYAGRLTGLAAAGVGALGRQTVGAYSYGYLARNRKRLEEEAKQGGGAGYAARAKLRTAGAASRATYDVRRSRGAKVVGATAGAALGAGGIKTDLGKPRREIEKGYAGTAEKQIEEMVKRSGATKDTSKTAKEAIAKDIESGVTMSSRVGGSFYILPKSKTLRKAAADKIRKGKDLDEQITELTVKREKQKRKERGEETEEENEKKEGGEESNKNA